MSEASHKSLPERVSYNFEAESITETWQGPYEDLNAMLTELAATTPEQEDGKAFVGGTLTRREGNRGTLEVEYKILQGYAWWGFSFSEISKPIKTWLATKITDDDDLLKDELGKLTMWEEQKNLGEAGLSNYNNFRYDDTNELTGDTLTLAKKIYNGIDSYSVYAPVATCRRMSVLPFTDGIGDIGKYVEELVSPAESVTINEGQLQAISPIKPFWLKTSDEISQNSDGTLSRTETWTGYDSVDKDLYEEAK